MKKTFCIFILSLVAILSISCQPPTSVETTGSIQGVVYGASSSQPLSGATVTTSPITSSKITDNNGGYLIENIDPAFYTVRAEKNGYHVNNTSVQVIAGNTTTADLQLSPLQPILAVSESNLNFGTSGQNMSFNIYNDGIETINYNIVYTADWLTINPSSGSVTTETDVINVSVNRSGLAYGNYYETITVTSNTNSIDIDVILTIPNPNSPQLSAYPLSLIFGDSESSKNFNIQNTGTGTLSWNITDDKSWITVTPVSGTTENEIDEISVIIDRFGQSPGTYKGAVTISSDGGNQNINIEMTVPDEPSLQVSTNSLDFGSETNSLTFNIENAGTGDLNWNVVDNKEWLEINPNSGTNSSTINVTVSRDGLSPGNYSGIITVSSNGGTDQIEISLNIPADEPPTSVELMTPTDMTENSISLTWTRNFDEDFAAYKLYRSNTAAVTQNSQLITTITSSSQNNFTDTGLQSNTTYYYRVYVMDEFEQHTPSNVISGTTSTQLGIWNVNATLGSHLYCVDALNENFAYAAGDDGKIYLWNGSSWVKENAPPTSHNIYDLKIITQTDVWAVGYEGIFHFNGAAWTHKVEDISVYCIDYLTADDIYVGCEGGKVGHYDGSNWSFITIDASDIEDIQIESSTSVWLLDTRGKIFHYNGYGWSFTHDVNISSYSYENFEGMDVINSSDIWVTRDDYISYNTDDWTGIFHWDGSEWSVVGNPDYLSGYIEDVWHISSNSVWFVGHNGKIYHFDGKNLTKITSSTDYNLYKICMISESCGWAVGEAGVILRYH